MSSKPSVRSDRSVGHKKDYSHLVRPIQSSYLRTLLVIAGTISFVVGVIGVFVPLLPTTPFLLLAAFCYARSSVRFYNYLLNSRHFGPMIEQWQTQRSITKKTRVLAIGTIVLSFGVSIMFFVPVLVGKLTMAALALLLSVFILRLPVRG